MEGNQYRINFDRTISPTLMAHVGAGFYRFLNPDSSPAGVLNYDAVGQLGLVGSASSPAGFPNLTNLGVNNQGGAAELRPQYGRPPVHRQALAGSAASCTFAEATPTRSAWRSSRTCTATRMCKACRASMRSATVPRRCRILQNSSVGGGSIGAGYASFLLGQATYTNVNAPRKMQMRKMNWAVYLQDNWKITRKLTLDYGLRWDYTPMGHEQHYREAEIGINTPNPAAGGIPGGYIFEGYGPGRCNCEFSKSYPFAFGPRLAVAYQINAKTVFRAGWGFTYSGGDSWGYMNGGTPVAGLGFNSVTNSTGYGFAVSRFQDGIQYNPADLYTATLNPGVAPLPGTLAPAPGWAEQFRDPNGGRPSRVNQWNISLQRQLTKDMSLEAAYVGNRGVWEESRSLAQLNAISPARLQALGLDLTNPATRTLLTSQICSTTAVNAGYKPPYAGFPSTASVAQSLRPFPEYNDALAWWFAPTGDSWYDSLQVKFTRRFSHGLDITSNFTYQKELCLGAVGCASANDVFNRDENKALTPSSTPFISVTCVHVSDAQVHVQQTRAASGGRLDLGRHPALCQRHPDLGGVLAHESQHLHVQHQHALQPRGRGAALPRGPQLRLHRSELQPADPQPGRLGRYARRHLGTGRCLLQRLPLAAPGQRIHELRPHVPAPRADVAERPRRVL